MFSVVIPLYNKRDSIKSTIQSVLNQTFKDFEVIVVDDGSTDGSIEIVRDISDSRIKVCSKKNQGPSVARNFGIEKAKFECIALLDADDLWEPTFLSEMNRLINKYPEASLYGSSYTYLYKSGGGTGFPDINLPINFEGYITDYFQVALSNPLYSSSCTVLKKSALSRIGFFDERLFKGEDMDMWIRFALTEKLVYKNASLAFYRINFENSSMKRKCDKGQSLIWNLGKFNEQEFNTPELKYFLDNLRLSHIKNYLNGNRSEVDDIDTLLNAVNLEGFPFYWNVIKVTPEKFRIPFYWTIKFLERVIKFPSNRTKNFL